MQKGFSGVISWQSERSLVSGNAMLFCINGKCMSGRITDLQEVDGQYRASVEFIEAGYFSNDVRVGSILTLQEASKMLGFIEATTII